MQIFPADFIFISPFGSPFYGKMVLAAGWLQSSVVPGTISIDYTARHNVVSTNESGAELAAASTY
jgi:hypothetical protein